MGDGPSGGMQAANASTTLLDAFCVFELHPLASTILGPYGYLPHKPSSPSSKPFSGVPAPSLPALVHCSNPYIKFVWPSNSVDNIR
ncbi:hypothetical protein H0H93_014988 [Arthromyces matolae]|nr:hypothetical protein H0H93_014988 [Arthromyces matolae]